MLVICPQLKTTSFQHAALHHLGNRAKKESWRQHQISPTKSRASILNIIDQQKQEGDKNFNYGTYDHDDWEEEDEANTSLNAIVRCILSIPKDDEDQRGTSTFK